MKKKIKRNTLKTDLEVYLQLKMKITKVISFLPVTVRKIRNKQINK